MNQPISIKRALISVSDKTGLSEFAGNLAERGIEIFSTGGTRQHLQQQGIQVVDIASYTQFPEMMDGRLKTLHPKVFGGILARHDHPSDLASLADHHIHLFELVVVNLYPFAQTISEPDVTIEEAIEQIDIGGPSLVRAAAKNHSFVTIVTQPKQYPEVSSEVIQAGATSLATRRRLAQEAFCHTANYDSTISTYLCAAFDDAEIFPETLSQQASLKQVLRYGENPHQRAALYADVGNQTNCLVNAQQLHGKELSYNNYLDLDAAWSIVRHFAHPTVSVIKHNNPCGIGSDEQLATALERALQGDPVSAFGSILAFNRPVDEACAEQLAAPGLFIEAIVAPSFAAAARETLTTKPKWRKNVRLLAVGDETPEQAQLSLRQIDGGVLVQDTDSTPDVRDDWKVVTQTQPTDRQVRDLQFANHAARYVKSNAILLARDQATVGIGAGQMSRVDAVEIAIRKAGPRAENSVLASDAFFPFADSIRLAADAGVTAIIQPGGSKKDPEVIEACDDHGLAMIMTGRRHFRH